MALGQPVDPATLARLAQVLYQRIESDPLLSPFFEHVAMGDQIRKQQIFIAHVLNVDAMGGSAYIAKKHESARLLGLQDHHFDAFITHFRESLDTVGVAPDIAAKVLTRFLACRNAIVRNQSATAN